MLDFNSDKRSNQISRLLLLVTFFISVIRYYIENIIHLACFNLKVLYICKTMNNTISKERWNQMSNISRLISSIISVLCEWLFGRHKVTLELPVCISFVWGWRCLGMPYQSDTKTHFISFQMFPFDYSRPTFYYFHWLSLSFCHGFEKSFGDWPRTLQFSCMTKTKSLVWFVDSIKLELLHPATDFNLTPPSRPNEPLNPAENDILQNTNTKDYFCKHK